VDTGAPTALTSGNGIEWSPAVLADGATVAFLRSEARRLRCLRRSPCAAGASARIAGDHLRTDFPSMALWCRNPSPSAPSDGIEAYGQLFAATPQAASGQSPPGQRSPAIVYVHGGGPRQMLLGWHTRWEYANDYGVNQYLASRGFVVLSVNYRLSVGYGRAFEFQERNRGPRRLRVPSISWRPDATCKHGPMWIRGGIGVWGASYGGYLTALALGRNSDASSPPAWTSTARTIACARSIPPSSHTPWSATA